MQFDRRLNASLFILALALLHCGSPTGDRDAPTNNGLDDDDGGSTDSGTGNNGTLNNGTLNNGTGNNGTGTNSAPTETCSGGAVTDRSTLYECVGEVGAERWSCWCDGETVVVVDEAVCAAALEDGCQPEALDPTYCRTALAACAADPETSGQWRCHCFDDDIVVTVEGEHCALSARRGCEGACESPAGSCVFSTETGDYDCQCTYYDRARSRWGQRCDAVLSALCEPRPGSCTGFQGFCDEGPLATGEWGYDCHCLDGDSGQLTLAELGGEDICTLALDQVCGAADGDPDACSRRTAWGSKQCSPVRSEAGAWECSCRFTCEDGGGAVGQETEAASCEEALESICPEIDTGC